MALQPEWDKGWIWGLLIAFITIAAVRYDSGDPAMFWPAFVLPFVGWLLFMAYVETQRAKP